MPPSLRRVPLALLAGMLALSVVPAPTRAQVTAGEYASRRTAMLAGVDSGVVLAFGGVEPVDFWPDFYQVPDFEYLTGFGEADAVLLMVKRNGILAGTLFVPTQNPMQARVVGARMRPDELETRVGVPGRDIGQFPTVIDSLAGSGLPFYVVPDFQAGEYMSQDSLTRGNRFLTQLRVDHPFLLVHSLDDPVTRLREKKSATEIDLLRRAARISAQAHREAMKATAPGCGENEIQGLLEGTFRRLGGDRPGYSSIVGSGPNATILHYTANDRTMRDGELLLIDAASAYRHYSADVTRTFPVNGRFNREQREIYQLVRDAQQAFVRQIRPGVPYQVADDSGKAVVAKGLVRLGLIQSGDSTFDPPEGMQRRCPAGGCPQARLYALHGYGGHGIGLEVHDPAQYYEEGHRFGAGDVFTVEPGLYVSPDLIAALPDTPRNRAMLAQVRPAIEKYKGIGVRIEDDYALTESGLEWLSSDVPRDIAEIETLMRQRGPELPGGGSCGRKRIAGLKESR